MEEKIELKQNIKEKLAEAIQLWADENMEGKPAILLNCMYISVEKAMIEDIKKINEAFKS